MSDHDDLPPVLQNPLVPKLERVAVLKTEYERQQAMLQAAERVALFAERHMDGCEKIGRIEQELIQALADYANAKERK